MQAELSSQSLDGTTLKCNKSEGKNTSETSCLRLGSGLQIALNSSKASYYEEITGSYVPLWPMFQSWGVMMAGPSVNSVATVRILRMG
jgi:hypothetical protein